MRTRIFYLYFKPRRILFRIFFVVSYLSLGQLTEVHSVCSRKPKIILVTILETRLISRKPKKTE